MTDVTLYCVSMLLISATLTMADNLSESKKNDRLMAVFEEAAGWDDELDAYELQIIMTSVSKPLLGREFHLATCYILVMKFDDDHSGYMNYEEFVALAGEFKSWQRSFRKRDMDRSDDFDMLELQSALRSLIEGFDPTGSGTMTFLMQRYGYERKVEFDDFLALFMKLQILTDQYMQWKAEGKVTLDYNEFLLPGMV